MAAAAAEVAAAGGGGEMVVVRLPPLSQDDPLFQDKKMQRILDSRNLSCLFQVPNSCSAADAFKVLDRMIQAARIAHMDELELYFTGDDDFGPLSTRNELESLNLLLKILNTLLLTANVGAMGVLQVLRDEILIRLRSLELEDNDQMVVQIRNQNMEDSLLKWGEQHGVKTKLQIAFFEGAGRGMVASENIDVGDIALEIPESSIISEELLCQSGMFLALKDLDSITTETMLLLWSIRERYNPSSKFKIYFEALPANFNTGLSFGIDALAALEGTLLFDELMQARQHLRQQYDELFPMLCIKFPDIFKQDVYTWDNFLWACELWYSNSMMVVLSSGKLTTCLIPIAGLLNHSVSPHILNYGRVDKVTKSLKFPLSRPCKAGEQCFLSYGKHPGSHLITFYGFLPRDNPYDVIPLDLDTSVDEEDSSSPSVTTSQTSHMVRGTWLSRLRGPPTYGLPHRLVSHLHAILGCNQNESAPEADNKENDRMVLETLLSIFTPMLEGLGEPDDFDRENACWDVNLALDYKDLQRRIVLSIVTSCTSGLAMLDS
uniref:SET domain-containing protein n=1 Tax=Oryza glaberrima TaxID=4538 RepID=I1QGU8_ORYGL